MNGLPRFARKSSRLALCAAVLMTPLTAVLAQDAPTPAMSTPAAAPAPAMAGAEAAAPATTGPAMAPAMASAEVKNEVENFWHFGKIARYDLASAEGQKIIAAGADPQAVLVAFEQVAAEHQDADRIDEWLTRWQGIDAMRDTTVKVAGLIADGYRARRSDPAFINAQIARLSVNERAYGLAMTRMRESGELAVPFLLATLQDPAKKNMQPTVRRALRDLGRYGLNPLVAATETNDTATLTVVVGVLGDLGYDSALPYLQRLSESDQTPTALKGAVIEAMSKIAPANSSVSAGERFYDLAEKIYAGTSSITDDARYPMSNIWYWDQKVGLTRVEVPHAIFADLMTMRATECTLKANGARSDEALSLWLSANYRREADLPEGATDATRPEHYPPAHYWGVQAGPQYLNAALARALRDRNSQVAYSAIRSLQDIVGQSNLFSSNQGRSLIDAMQYSDRRVRFEAAFAMAAALPQKSFDGQTRVIPLLAEAISQTGQPSVLVVMPSQDQVNKAIDDLKGAGFAAAGAIAAEGAISTADSLPAVDVILVSEDLGAGHVDQLFNLAAQTPKLAGAGRLIMTKTNASMYEQRKATDTGLSTTTATDAAGLKQAIEESRTKTGALPLDPAVATDYATRAAELMLKVGISRGQVYDLAPAKATLLSALTDARPEIVKLAGQVVALLDDKDAQAGLLQVASDAKTADDVKISLYKSLATSAKFYGNHLDESQSNSLEQTVADAENLDVRSAAAEARGAMNLPASQAKSLVVKQSRV